MGFESRAISARVTKQIVTIFNQTCDNLYLTHLIISSPKLNDFRHRKIYL